MLTIRAFEPADLDPLYAIALATGDEGRDASHLYADGRLIGHIYAAPYAILDPGLVLVVADEAGVAGYVLGTTDTAAWEDRLVRDWWPALQRQYPDPGPTLRADSTADQRRALLIHHPERTPTAVKGLYPAHVHLNLLPRARGQGVGRRLFEAWVERASARGAGPIHAGVNRGNARGLRFWARQGFEEMSGLPDAHPRTAWMGRPAGVKRPVQPQEEQR